MCVGPRVHNICIFETSGPIAISSYVKNNWGGGKAALGFWPDRIRTLVSMATYSSHRVKIGKTVLPLFLYLREAVRS